MTYRFALMCVFALGMATGCGGGTTGPAVDGRTELLQTLFDDVLLPRHEDFQTQAAAMARAVEAHCESPTDESFETAREAWSAARGRYGAPRPNEAHPAAPHDFPLASGYGVI